MPASRKATYAEVASRSPSPQPQDAPPAVKGANVANSAKEPKGPKGSKTPKVPKTPGSAKAKSSKASNEAKESKTAKAADVAKDSKGVKSPEEAKDPKASKLSDDAKGSKTSKATPGKKVASGSKAGLKEGESSRPKEKGKSKQASSPEPKFIQKFRADGTTVHIQVDDPSPDVLAMPDSPLTEIVEEDSDLDAGVRLDPDDTMYRGKDSKNRIETPPPSIIQTRAAAAKSKGKGSGDTQPPKRPRSSTKADVSVAPSGDSDEETLPLSKRIKLLSPKKRVDSPEVEDAPSSPMAVDGQISGEDSDMEEAEIEDMPPDTYSPVPSTNFQDVEAQEDVEEDSGEDEDMDGAEDESAGDSSGSEQGGPLDEALDAYDTQDSFINDALELSVYDSDEAVAGDAEGHAASAADDSDSDDNVPLSRLVRSRPSSSSNNAASAHEGSSLVGSASSSSKAGKVTVEEEEDIDAPPSPPLKPQRSVRKPSQSKNVLVEEEDDVDAPPSPSPKSQRTVRKPSQSKKGAVEEDVVNAPPLTPPKPQRAVRKPNKSKKVTVEEEEDVDAPPSPPLKPQRVSSKPSRSQKVTVEEEEDVDTPPSPPLKPVQKTRKPTKSKKVTVEEEEDVDAPPSPPLKPQRVSRKPSRSQKVTVEEEEDVDAPPSPPLKPVQKTRKPTKSKKVTVEEVEDVDAPPSPPLKPQRAVSKPRVSKKVTVEEEEEDVDAPPSPPLKPQRKVGRSSQVKQEKDTNAEPTSRRASPKVSIEEVKDVDVPKSKKPIAKAKPAARPAGTSKKAPNAPQDAKGKHVKRTFKSMLGGSLPGVAKEEEVYLQDLEWRRLGELPKFCEVMNEDLQDPMLKPYYKDLPNLNAGSFTSWSDARGPGSALFSNWSKVCSEMDFDSCISAMTFDKLKNFYNLARASPCDVVTRELPNIKNRWVMYTPDLQPVIAVSPVRLTESSVLGPPPMGGIMHKRVSGIFHSQDYERVVAFICMVFRQKPLSAQIYKDAMQFSTRTAESKNRASSISPKKRASVLDSGVRSPATASSSNSLQAGQTDRYNLAFEDRIPVYDCRDMTLDFSTDLEKLDSFPRWVDKEIPLDSFVVVGHTVSVYWASEAKGWSVSFNIQWVIILGSPDDAE